MGSFANSVFSVLLGWIRNLVTQGWSLLSNSENGGFLAWIGENWKVLVLVLCVGGMVIDFLVYLARWKPQKVWASFFRRLRGEGVEADDPEAVAEEAVRKAEARKQFREPRRPASRREDARQQTRSAWLYPDGTARQAVGVEHEVPMENRPYVPSEQPPMTAPLPDSSALPEQYVNQFARPDSRLPYEAPAANWVPVIADAEQTVSLGAMGRSYRRTRSARHQETAAEIRAPYEAPAAIVLTDRLAGYPQPKEAAAATPAVRELPENEPDTMNRPPRKMAAKVSAAALLGLHQDDDEVKLNYTPPAPAVDHREAYHAPVYPAGWKPPSQGGTET